MKLLRPVRELPTRALLCASQGYGTGGFAVGVPAGMALAGLVVLDRNGAAIPVVVWLAMLLLLVPTLGMEIRIRRVIMPELDRRCLEDVSAPFLPRVSGKPWPARPLVNTVATA